MRQMNRVLFFLLLNIFISACTTLAVLVAYDQFRAPLPGGLIAPLLSSSLRPERPTPVPSQEATAHPAVTPTPAAQIHAVLDGETFESIAQLYHVTVDELVQANGYTQAQTLSPGELLRVPLHPALIDSVVGAGDLQTEHVIILSNLNSELSLAGWQLEDGQGSLYTFPQVTIFIKGGAVSLFSKAGADTATELYWNLPEAAWQSGKTVRLLDPQGIVQATYTIP